LVVHRATNPYPATELDDTWREPERKFNSGRRSDLRRARRRAQELGEVAFELLSPGPAEVDALLDEAIAVEAAGWKGRAGTAMATDDAEGAFFRHWALLAAQDGTLRVALMRIDGRPVAMQLAAETGGRLWLFKIGYDESVNRCSPGNLLMLEVVRACAERELTSVEFLGRREGWTQLWSTVERPCVGVAAYPFSLASVPVLAVDVLARYRAKRQEARAAATRGRAETT
jgi:CelD/BcsL family acetyltransferase involved in cellulose biosynthesis